MSLEVTRLTIAQVLAKLRSGEWQVPKFQREFVWNQEQVFALLRSVVKSRPLGLVTLWGQPQENPHTDSEPIRLESALFKHFQKNPAVMKLILDGRQRLTAIAMAFGGLRESDARRSFSGRWFFNLDAESETEQVIVYKKPSQVEAEGLNRMPTCLVKALIPLDEYEKYKDYSGNVNNKDFYATDEYPPEIVREARRKRLADFHENFLRFQIPVAELPECVSLAEVCDIFDVLNTTGTKVSTFDLIHNLNFAQTMGVFDLRGTFVSCQEENPSLGLLCDSGRQEFFCQLVTGCYLTEQKPVSRKPTEFIRTIKGGDLINTPTIFYEEFVKNLPRIDSYCATLFSSEVLGAKLTLRELPYPVAVILYVSLRWWQERNAGGSERFTVSQLNDVFRAFFWGNALSGRYDQGFLTLFAADLKSLREILIESKDLSGAEWSTKCNDALDSKVFTPQNRRKTVEDLKQIVGDGEVRGATKQALALFLLSRVRQDLTDGKVLDRFTEDPGNRVQLHHIFPRDWCKNNMSAHLVLQNRESVNAFANLVPLRATSNNKWKTKSPSTAIQEFGLTWEQNEKQLGQAFITREQFDLLKADKVGDFWTERAALIASEVSRLQYL